jgi:hypothetical protein
MGVLEAASSGQEANIPPADIGKKPPENQWGFAEFSGIIRIQVIEASHPVNASADSRSRRSLIARDLTSHPSNFPPSEISSA